MKLDYADVIIGGYIVIMLGLLIFAGLGIFSASKNVCTKAEVYLLNNTQEDDLFIPASSVGKVDLKR